MVDVYKYVNDTDTEEEIKNKAKALRDAYFRECNYEPEAVLAVCEYAELRGFDCCRFYKGDVLYLQSFAVRGEERKKMIEEALSCLEYAANNEGKYEAIRTLFEHYMDPMYDGDDIEKGLYWRARLVEALEKEDWWKKEKEL